MPTYEYICKNAACGHEWEEEHPITREPTKSCPECGQDTAQRLISGRGAFVLNGAGWASDGYASHT